MITPCQGVSRKIRTAVPVLLAFVLTAGGAWAQNGVWEKWSSESFTLTPRESFQFHVGFDGIQVRSWKLVVNGGDMNCDLSVLRVKGEALLYYETDQQRHEVLIPWGTPLKPGIEEYTGDPNTRPTSEEQAAMVGIGHDGMHFFAKEGKASSDS